MGSKDKGKKESKKPSKKTPKSAPTRKREDFTPTSVRTVREASKRD